MAEIVLFHHVQGLTDGVRAFGDRLAEGGHTVHVPDLFGGETAPTIEEGFAVVQRIGRDEVTRRADAAVADLPPGLVLAGISFGVAHAQRLAQTRPGTRAALLLASCFPVTGEWAFGPWPDGLLAQVHGKEGDEFFDEDLPAARELVEVAGDAAELFVYPGAQHLFMDSSLPDHDADATALVLERARRLLAAVDGR